MPHIDHTDEFQFLFNPNQRVIIMGRKRKKSGIEWKDGHEVDAHWDEENPDLSYFDSRTEKRQRNRNVILPHVA